MTLGTEMVVYAQNDPRFRAIVNACALSLCDTVGLLAVARRRGAPLRERVTGVELIERLCARAAADGTCRSIFWAARRASPPMRRRSWRCGFPGLQVAGTRNGFFDDAQSPEVAAGDRSQRCAAALRRDGLAAPRVLAGRAPARNRLRRRASASAVRST